MKLLAEKKAQGERIEPSKAGVNPLGEELTKTTPPEGVSPSLKTGKEGESAPDEAKFRFHLPNFSSEIWPRHFLWQMKVTQQQRRMRKSG
jgi:hypothetical protein